MEIRFSENGNELVWVAALLKKCDAGTLKLRRLDSKIVAMERFEVHPKYQGLGIGSTLLNTAIEHLRRQNFQVVTLTTCRLSSRAEDLLMQAGFVQIANQPVTYVVPNELVMELKL